MKLLLRTQFLKMLVEDCFAAHNWNFATGQQKLARLAAVLLIFGMLPMLCLQIPKSSRLILLLSMILLSSMIFIRYIYINAGTNDDVVLNYIFRVDAQYWPPAFALWVIYRMASVLALSVTRKADVANSYVTLAEQHLMSLNQRLTASHYTIITFVQIPSSKIG